MLKPNKPCSIALEIESEFTASHSLEGFEVVHFHLWKVFAEFQASLPLASDRLIDLVYLQGVMDQVLNPLHGTYLNQTLSMSPTTENLASYVWDEILRLLPEAPLTQIRIHICNLEGKSTGSARVFK